MPEEPEPANLEPANLPTCEPPLANLGQRARTAAGWQFLSQGISTGLQMLTSIVLARLLMPKDFGIVAMATMVTGLGGAFQDLGLGQALVQRREITPEHTRSAFWGTLVMGVLLCAMVVVIAPWMGACFHEPRMVPVLRLISLTFVVSPFAVVPRSLLQRKLDFRTPFVAGLASSVAYGGTGIIMALLGYGYWSLVGAGLASALANTVALCGLTRHAPPLVPAFRGIRDLYSFGVGATGVGLMNYVAQQVDYFVIGRRLSAEALGVYSRAFTLVHMPHSLLSSVSNPVLFPVFSALQTDTRRAKEGFGLVIRITATIAFPLLGLMAVVAPEFIPVVFGTQWQGAVRPTQILAIAGMFRVLASPGSALVIGLGRIYSAAACQAAYAIAVAAGAWYGAKWGTEGVAVAVVLSSGVLFTAIAGVADKACCFSLTDYAAQAAVPALFAALVAVPAFGARELTMACGASQGLVLTAALCAGTTGGVLGLAGPAKSLRPVLGNALAVLRGAGTDVASPS